MYIVASYVTSQNSFVKMIQYRTNIPSITLNQAVLQYMHVDNVCCYYTCTYY